MTVAAVRQQVRALTPFAILRLVLVAFAVVLTVRATLTLAFNHPIGVDTDIPLLAAERWLAGGQPYLSSAFDETAGRGLPFLYPPHVLPFLALLSLVPRGAVIAVAVVAWAVVAALGVRRLGIAWPFVPAILVWPPFAEGIIGTNAEILSFAAFAYLLVPSVALDERRRTRLVDALLVVATCVAKVSQVHALANVMARRPTAGLIALGLMLGLAVVTLPIVGVSLWWEWLEHVVRAGDPSWPPIGAPLSILVPRMMALGITALTIGLAFVVRGPRAAAWLGLLIILGSPSLHLFGFVYLLPAFLLIRREVALAAATLVATATVPGVWLAVIVVGWALLAGRRWTYLRANRAPDAVET